MHVLRRTPPVEPPGLADAISDEFILRQRPTALLGMGANLMIFMLALSARDAFIAVVGLVRLVVDLEILRRFGPLVRARANRVAVPAHAQDALERMFGFTGVVTSMLIAPALTGPSGGVAPIVLAMVALMPPVVLATTVCFSWPAYRRLVIGSYGTALVVTALTWGTVALLPVSVIGVGVIVLAVVVGDVGTRTRADHVARLVVENERNLALQMQARTITELDDERRRAFEQALTDGVTELPNRKAFMAEIDRRLDGTPATLVLLDLDLFKNINDSLGHNVGDEVLEATARVLRGLDAADGFAARLGGDEFGMVLSGALSREALDAHMARIRAGLENLVIGRGNTLSVSATAGSAIYPEDAADRASLLHAADLALREAKGVRRGEWRAFHAALSDNAMRESQIEALLRQALRDGSVTVHLQPQVDMASGAIVGAEALTRFGGALAAHRVDQVFAVAESRGLGQALGVCVLERALDIVATLRARPVAVALPVAINLSASMLKASEPLLERLERARAAGLPPSAIRLEITEDAISGRGVEAIRETLEQLAAQGHPLSLDDFGTGQSSLAHLHSLPLHEIKVDKRFVQNIETSRRDQAIVCAALTLCDRMGIDCVVEGIGTDAQRDCLLALGARLGQGYRWARPMPLASFERQLDAAAPRVPEPARDAASPPARGAAMLPPIGSAMVASMA